MISKKCVICGIEFGVKPCHEFVIKCCSWKCANEYKHRIQSGVNHYKYVGGVGLRNNGRLVPTYYPMLKGLPEEKRAYRLHRAIAEVSLGRSLKSNECVHHVNGNTLDYANKNLVICSNRYNKHIHSMMFHFNLNSHTVYTSYARELSNSFLFMGDVEQWKTKYIESANNFILNLLNSHEEELLVLRSKYKNVSNFYGLLLMDMSFTKIKANRNE